MRNWRRNPPDPRIQLTLDESVRAIGLQENSLDSLHARAGLVLSAAAITSSLFGTQILRDGTLTCLAWAALGAFVVVATGSLYVLWPRSTWRFSNSPSTLLTVWVDREDASIDTMRREVAEFNQGAWRNNREILIRLYAGFQIASTALGIEVVLWFIDLGTR